MKKNKIMTSQLTNATDIVTTMPKVIKAHLNEQAKSAGAKFTEPRVGDAGYDLYASEAVTIFSGEQVIVQTGLTLEIPEGMIGVIKDRSSMAMRRIYVHAGVIDSGYRGAVGVLLDNHSGKNFHIEPGQRVAQLLIIHANRVPVDFVGLEGFSRTVRGDGAFGSTGK